MKSIFSKLTIEQQHRLRDKYQEHRQIVQGWLFKTSDVSTEDAMKSLSWLSWYCWNV